MPGMPAVGYLSKGRFMGVLYLGCTTRSVRTAAWDTEPRKSLLLLRPQASIALSERQGTQTPSLAPRAPPSRLKPEMEQQKVVVFLRERKQGAGQELTRRYRQLSIWIVGALLNKPSFLLVDTGSFVAHASIR